MAVDGRFAYGWLRAERGVHRLVRIRRIDAQKRRQTTFALVEVMPEVEDDTEIELNMDEIRGRELPLAGAGGQHVQEDELGRPADARPTGIIVARSRTSARRRRTGGRG